MAQEGSGIEEVDGGDGKRSAVAKTPFDSQGSGECDSHLRSAR